MKVSPKKLKISITALLAVTMFTSCGMSDELKKTVYEKQIEICQAGIDELESKKTSIPAVVFNYFFTTTKPKKINLIGMSENELSSMKINDSRSFSPVDQTVTDTIGNTYDYKNSYIMGYNRSYATYYLGGAYTTLSGEIVVPDSFQSNDIGHFTITIREKESQQEIIIYASHDITRQTLAISLDKESIDLSKAEWITFKFNSDYSSSVCLHDIRLYK